MTDLHEVLASHAERVVPDEPDLARVRQLSRRRSRRQGTAIALGLASVLAAVSLIPQLLDPIRGSGGATGHPSSAPPTSPSTAPPTGELSTWLSALKRGPAPQLSTLRGDTLDFADGGESALPPRAEAEHYRGYLPVVGGDLVVREGPGGTRVVVLDITGRAVFDHPGSASLGRDATGAAWLARVEGQVRLFRGISEPGVPVPVGLDARVLDVRGDSVWLASGRRTFVVQGDRVRPGPADLTAVDLESGQAARRDEVVGLRSGTLGKRLWREPGRRIVAFGAHGRWLAALDNATGADDAALLLVDTRTRRVVAKATLLARSERLEVDQVEFEPDGDLLAVVTDSATGTQTVLRLRRDGVVERALPLKDASRRFYVLETAP